MIINQSTQSGILIALVTLAALMDNPKTLWLQTKHIDFLAVSVGQYFGCG